MITNSGLNLIRSFLTGGAPSAPSHMAVGTGTTGVVAGDTALETEVERNAQAGKVKTDNGVHEYVMSLASTDANGSSLSEVGVFNAAASGTMLLRQTHVPYSKTASFSVKYVIRHTQVAV